MITIHRLGTKNYEIYNSIFNNKDTIKKDCGNGWARLILNNKSAFYKEEIGYFGFIDEREEYLLNVKQEIEKNMSWNYRILAQEQENGEIYFQIHEVYYNENGIPDGYTANGVTVGTDSVKGINWILNRMKEATKKPILWEGKRFPEEYKTFKNVVNDGDNHRKEIIKQIMKEDEELGLY